MGNALKAAALLILITAIAAAIYFLANKPVDRLAILQDAKDATVRIINLKDSETGMAATGSGAIISEDGYIVSNNHVTEGSEELYVILRDHRVFKAELIGALVEVDLSLLKIGAENLTYFNFFNDNALPGQEVYAIGSPLHMEQSMSYGIISALKRGNSNPTALTYYLQSNIACNPGNSGGPLVSTNGELIGINSWITVNRIDDTAIPNPSYCFSVPSRVIQYVVNHLKDNKKVRPKTIGAAYKEVTIDSAQESGFGRLVGVHVKALDEDGHAKEAGIQEGDIIVEFNDEEINSMVELRTEITLADLNENSVAQVWRNGEMIEVELTPDYDYNDKESVYKAIKEAHESCGLDIVCVAQYLEKASSQEKNKYKQQLLSSVATTYKGEIERYQAHEEQCANDEYQEAKEAISACFIDVYQRVVDGNNAKEGDETFNQCVKETLAELGGNPYAKAGIKLLGNGDDSSQGSEDEDKTYHNCMVYWLD